MSNTIIRGSPYTRIIKPKTTTKIFEFTPKNLLMLPSISSNWTTNGVKLFVLSSSEQKIRCASNTRIDNIYPKGSLVNLSGTGQNSIQYTNKTSNNDFDLTGYMLEMLIVKQQVDNPQATDIILAKQTYQGNCNQFSIELSPTLTATLPVGNYYQVLQIIDPIGNKFENSSVATELIKVDINQIT